MNFNFENNIPIYVQLLEQIKIQIISGYYAAGERLPSVRDLSLKLKVNPNTLQRALSELEEMGLIYTDRTNGKFVADDRLTIIKGKQKILNQKISEFFKEMQNLGLSKSDIVQMVEIEGAKKWV